MCVCVHERERDRCHDGECVCVHERETGVMMVCVCS